MALPEPIATISSTILLNIASDVVSHQAKHLEKTFAGQLLKRGGLIEPDFADRLRESIRQALQLLFQTHPEYNLSGIEDFFHDPIIVQGIGNYILERKTLNQQQVQQALDKHLTNNWVTIELMKRRKVIPQNILRDFFTCYRYVLNTQLSIAEMSLLLEILDQKDEVLLEIRASEARMQEYIESLKKTVLSPQALLAASDANQQQGTTELIQDLKDAKLVRLDEALLTIQKRLQTLPSIFTEGICKGLRLHPAPYEYFVSHGFPPHSLVDWRKSLTKALAQADDTQIPLKPYFHGDTIMGGFRLCGICEKLYATRFSIFLLPPDQNRNVYFELGIVLGMGSPFLLIKPRGAQPPPLLEGLSIYTSEGTFRAIVQQLPGKINKIEEYHYAVVRMLRDLPIAGKEYQYLVTASDCNGNNDIEWIIEDVMKATYPDLKMVSLTEEIETATSTWSIENLVDTIQTARFAVYCISEDSSPTTFLALGISVALNRPYLMIRKADSDVPLDLRGIGAYKFANLDELEREFVVKHRSRLDKYSKR